MADKNLYVNDLIHRFASHTFTETTVDSMTRVDFKNAGSVVIASAKNLVVIDAYHKIRTDLLKNEFSVFLSTTTQRDALTSMDKGIIILNITTAKFEIFDGTSWIGGGMQDISCKVTKSSNQSISTNTDTIITWDQEKYDTDNMHDNSTNNSRITIKTAGKYSLITQSEWANQDSGIRELTILKNGTTIIARILHTADDQAQRTLGWQGELAVNDYVELRVRHAAPGNLNFIGTGELETYMAIFKFN